MVAAHFGYIVEGGKRDKQLCFAQNGVFPVRRELAAFRKLGNLADNLAQFFALAEEKQDKRERNHVFKMTEFENARGFVEYVKYHAARVFIAYIG